jgi:hypothetical protein
VLGSNFAVNKFNMNKVIISLALIFGAITANSQTMNNLCRVTSNGYNDSADSADARYAMKEALNAQRTEDYRNGRYTRAGRKSLRSLRQLRENTI